MSTTYHLERKLLTMIEEGKINFQSTSRCFGYVEAEVRNTVFKDEEFTTAVPREDWDNDPTSGLAKNLADLISQDELEFLPGVEQEMKEGEIMKRYIALYRSEAVRDVQICKEDPSSDREDFQLDDDIWEDCTAAQVYVGLFNAMNEEAAQKAAAEAAGCDPRCLCLIPVGDEEEFNYLLKFTAGSDFESSELAEKQLRALWTAYCFHENLDADTAEYDAKLQILYHQLPGDQTSCHWADFEGFAMYMCEYLV